MLVYAAVNCFVDRNETNVAKVLLYITCSTWLNCLFLSLVTSCKFYFSKKVKFRFTSPTGQIKTLSMAQVSSSLIRIFQTSSIRFDIDLQQIFLDISLRFMFSKKATKIDKIFTVDLTFYVVSVKSTVKILSIFVAFLENTNFTFI